MTPVPSGFDELVSIYGDPRPFIHREEGRVEVSGLWPELILTAITLPESLALSWDSSKQVTRISCNRKCAESLTQVLSDIHSDGLWPRLRSFGGCYAFRLTRGGTKFSTHSWGAAVDFATVTNQLGTPGDMDQRIVEHFEGAGWVWGGRWSRPDPMHFQRVRDY